MIGILTDFDVFRQLSREHRYGRVHPQRFLNHLLQVREVSGILGRQVTVAVTHHVVNFVVYFILRTRESYMFCVND